MIQRKRTEASISTTLPTWSISQGECRVRALQRYRHQRCEKRTTLYITRTKCLNLIFPRSNHLARSTRNYPSRYIQRERELCTSRGIDCSGIALTSCLKEENVMRRAWFLTRQLLKAIRMSWVMAGHHGNHNRTGKYMQTHAHAQKHRQRGEIRVEVWKEN